MLHRQELIISLINCVGGGISHLQLVKLCFLMATETESKGGNSYYEFFPYHYGPYSFSLRHEIDKLVREGYISNAEEDKWSLTSFGNRRFGSIPWQTQREIRSLLKKYEKLTEFELLDLVYDRYEWFTVNSAYPERRRMQRPCANPAIYTTGYEGRSIDGFLNDLLKVGISRIIDVRNNPISRRYGFHKKTLKGLCENIGIEYFHIPELGIPPHLRRELTTKEDYQKLFNQYDSEVLSKQKKIIRQAISLIKEKATTLMCMESDPNQCHRHRLAIAISKSIDLPIIHLKGVRNVSGKTCAGSHYSSDIPSPIAVSRRACLYGRNN